MNRRQKIIVSITGIFIVLLALVGLTYAYFLTRITGNENEKSISVTTANLELVYAEENDAYVIGEDEIIEPGKIFETKTFTVRNNGNNVIDSYAVILEDVSITYTNAFIDENDNEIKAGTITTLGSTIEGKENDFTLKISCKNQDNEECNGYNAELLEKNGILLTNSIEVEETHTYTATLTYNETNVDQSADMNKKYNGKFNIIDASNTVDIEGTVTSYEVGDYIQTNSIERVSVISPNNTYKIVGLETGTHEVKVCASTVTNCTKDNAKLVETINIVEGDTASGNNETKTITITDDSRLASLDINITNGMTLNTEIKEYNPYKEGTLAYNILLDNEVSEPLSEPGLFPSGYKFENELVSFNEAILSTTFDDEGLSYYYRGTVENNYVTYSNMCWRIVRIQGDGTVKLVLADWEHPCGIVNGYNPNDDDSSYIADSEGNARNDILYKTDHKPNDRLYFEDSDIPIVLQQWANDRKLDFSKLENSYWCNDVAFKDGYFLSVYRLKTSDITLKCNIVGDNGTKSVKYKNTLGVLTADEAVFAGGVDFEKSFCESPVDQCNYIKYYLKTNATKYNYYTMSPFWRDDTEELFGYGIIGVSIGGLVNGGYLYANAMSGAVRPSIVLKANTELKTDLAYIQDGTIDKPYVIG